MIEAQGLTRYYGDFAALRDATFTIPDGEIVGFLGLNGAGKSTVLKILAGLLLPSAGKVTIDGIDATTQPDALRRKIGFLPEDPPLYGEMRIAEFLEWVGQLKGRSRAQVRAALPEVLEQCELTDFQDRVISELSHGYKKRVGIAHAIIHKPDVVILDEPISGLDPQQIVQMRAVVRNLTANATVLISSHILSEISLTCERVLMIHQGRLVMDGGPKELGGRSSEGRLLRLELRGDRAKVDDALAESPLVSKAELRSAEDGLVTADVSLTGDHREKLVAELVTAGFGIRAVSDAVSELEQVFLECTRTQVLDKKAGQRVKV
ncbi:MAG: ABC transporter ATP-binding protein [Nannocystaceae bacterium]|nr:ABC transporter ATP-binding protein [Nannocystaceae bacterium]